MLSDSCVLPEYPQCFPVQKWVWPKYTVSVSSLQYVAASSAQHETWLRGRYRILEFCKFGSLMLTIEMMVRQPSQIQNVVKFTFIIIIFHTWGTFFVRLSVCLFVLRLVPPNNRTFHRWTWGAMAFFALVTTSTFMTMCLQCRPIQGLWDRSIKAQCISLYDTDVVARLQGGKWRTGEAFTFRTFAHYGSSILHIYGSALRYYAYVVSAQPRGKYAR